MEGEIGIHLKRIIQVAPSEVSSNPPLRPRTGYIGKLRTLNNRVRVMAMHTSPTRAKPTHPLTLREGLLQRSVSVRCGAVVIITHAPSHRIPCETHTYRRRVVYCPPSLRLCRQRDTSGKDNHEGLGAGSGAEHLNLCSSPEVLSTSA